MQEVGTGHRSIRSPDPSFPLCKILGSGFQMQTQRTQSIYQGVSEQRGGAAGMGGGPPHDTLQPCLWAPKSPERERWLVLPILLPEVLRDPKLPCP